MSKKAFTFSILSIGATTATVKYVGAGGTPIFDNAKYISGTDYLGVPGPELAGGLPFLALAVAYGGYRFLRNARAQKQA